MRGLVLISAICLQLGWSYGHPGGSLGVGAYAYSDSAGNRYGGTYGLKDGQVFSTKGDDYAVPFAQNTFREVDDFFPEYFRNLENLLQETFNSNTDNQKLAFGAARKAYDLTSNQAGYIPPLASRFPSFGHFPEGFPDFGAIPDFSMPNFGGQNSAIAGAQIGPGFSHQLAAINPTNPQMANVDVTDRFSESNDNADKPEYHSVQSSSYSSSSNLNGKETNHRGAETVVNNNGKVTKYKVNN